MNKPYKHTQIGYFLLVVLSALLVAFIIYGITAHYFDVIGIVLIMFIVLIFFSVLTVKVNDKFIQIKFGFGLFKKNFFLKDIESYEIVKNPWHYGWGIHWILDGWVYNVSGSYGVKLTMKNGIKRIIGSDEPEKFFDAIQNRINKNGE